MKNILQELRDSHFFTIYSPNRDWISDHITSGVKSEINDGVVQPFAKVRMITHRVDLHLLQECKKL